MFCCASQVIKLGDNQPKVREASCKALLSLARCEPVGSEFVVRHVTKALPKRQTGNRIWRPLESRLQLLKELLLNHGIGPGLSTETLMGFIKENGATAHTFQEVRNAARELTVALFDKVRDDINWEPHLAILRVKQREEYEIAFENLRTGIATSGRDMDVARLKSSGSRGRGRGMLYDNKNSNVYTNNIHGEKYASHTAVRPVASGKMLAGGTEVEVDTNTDDYIGEEGEDEDDETESFKDEIMKQLEEKAFSIEEAHNILTIQFGRTSGNRVKDAVLAEWCGEVGLTESVEKMTEADRLQALEKVSHWLFQ